MNNTLSRYSSRKVAMKTLNTITEYVMKRQVNVTTKSVLYIGDAQWSAVKSLWSADYKGKSDTFMGYQLIHVCQPSYMRLV